MGFSEIQHYLNKQDHTFPISIDVENEYEPQKSKFKLFFKNIDLINIQTHALWLNRLISVLNNKLFSVFTSIYRIPYLLVFNLGFFNSSHESVLYFKIFMNQVTRIWNMAFPFRTDKMKNLTRSLDTRQTFTQNNSADFFK